MPVRKIISNISMKRLDGKATGNHFLGYDCLRNVYVLRNEIKFYLGSVCILVKLLVL